MAKYEAHCTMLSKVIEYVHEGMKNFEYCRKYFGNVNWESQAKIFIFNQVRKAKQQS